MVLNDIYDRLKSFTALALNNPNLHLTIIEANQNAPRPKKPFLTISVGPMNVVAMPVKAAIDANGVQQVISYMSFIAEFNAYSDTRHESEEILSTLQKYFRTDLAFRHFKGDISYLSTVSGVMTIPQVEGVVWENRAILEAEFSVTQTILDDVGLIEHVVITDEASGEEFTIDK